MNERIKELAEQTDKWFEEDGHSYSRPAWNKKFAELIVKEAIKKIEAVGCKSSNDIPFEITELFVSQIKQHLGVK